MKFRYYLIFTTIFCLLISISTGYPGDTPSVITLRECIRIGLKQNLELKASRFSIERAKYAAKAAHADFFPKLKLQGTYQWIDNPVKIDIPEITIHTPMGPLVSPRTIV